VTVSLSPSRRAWQRFRRNRLGFGSFVIFCTLFVLSLGAELISNDKPLVARYDAAWYFPILKSAPETTFGGDFETPTDFLDPFIRAAVCTRPGNWALYPLNPYHHGTIDYFRQGAEPRATIRRQLAGHGRPGSRRGGPADLWLPHLGTVCAGPHRHRHRAWA
jgi:microcin C transport system permease protein